MTSARLEGGHEAGALAETQRLHLAVTSCWMVAGQPCGEERPIALIIRKGVRTGGTSAQVRTSWRGQGYLETSQFPRDPEIYLSGSFLSTVAFSFSNRFFFLSDGI